MHHKSIDLKSDNHLFEKQWWVFGFIKQFVVYPNRKMIEEIFHWSHPYLPSPFDKSYHPH